jgi:hypothetical protein
MEVITREAFRRGLSVIDLRILCDEDADLANPIEPSERGGRTIASAIAAFVTDTPRSGRNSVFGGGR